MNDETDILDLIAADAWRMEVLRAARGLDLPDWAIGAGFVRAAVWDALTSRPEPTPLADVDVVYFDPGQTARSRDEVLEAALSAALPGVPWSVRNQARMHENNEDAPYRDTADAIAHWLETPTCVAVRLRPDDTLALVAPHGVGDLLALRVRPTAAGRARRRVFLARMAEKRWPERWPGLTIEEG